MKNLICWIFKHKFVVNPNATITVGMREFDGLKCKRCRAHQLRDRVTQKLHPYCCDGEIFIEYIS